MDCSQFLERYSEYRDDVLEEALHEAFEAHRLACASCARYDRVVSQGVRLFRDLPEIEPSDDFLPRLQHRIFHVEDEMRGVGRHTSGASATLTLVIAALVAIAVWGPTAQREAPVLELPAVAARAPQPKAEVPSLFRTGPLLTPARTVSESWSPALGGAARNDLFFRYSPLGASYSAQTVSSP